MVEYTEEDGKKFLRLARQAIEGELTGKSAKIPNKKKFRQARGIFVTLTKKGKLRGCIGFPEPVYSIGESIIKAAKAAAFSDLRFSPVEARELRDIKIEISILTIPQKCKPEDIQVGKDGIICNYLGYSGLLLPQVATEHKLDRIQFLEALCEKAGLPNDTWHSDKFELKKFQCQIFSE
jgi:AmmeMemoRadiSam system protein A